MKNKPRRIVMVALLFLSPILVAGTTIASSGVSLNSTATDSHSVLRPNSFADLVDAVGPAVVSITTQNSSASTPPRDGIRPSMPGDRRPVPGFQGNPELEQFLRRFFGPGHTPPTPGPRQGRAQGSGFIIDASGLVVTNHHVVARVDKIEVVLADGRTLPARIQGHDPKTDIALLQIDSDEKFPFVRFGDSTKARVGDWVIAIGNPFGLGGTATTGIISARGRDINAGPYDDYIQIDAPINRGNSGGPLFDTSGLVIGVNTAIYSPSGGNVGIGFAVPAEQAERIIAQLRDRGVVLRAWLGVHIQRVTPDLAESFGLDKSHGALVSKVEPDSPAENAGIVAGDVILGFDGNTVDRMKRLPRLVASATIGDKVGVNIWRDGREITLYPVMQPTGNTSRIAAYSTQRDHGPANLGLLLSALDHDTRQRYGIGADAAGILVEQVKPGSQAADKGLKRGDLIVQVERRPVDTPARMTELVHTAQQNNQKVVLLLIQREGQQHFVTLRLA